METKEWTYQDRSDWKAPELAEGEPDKRQWLHSETEVPCLVVRNNSGSLCGYIGVRSGHPWFEKDYDALRLNDGDYPSAHGGLTYAASGWADKETEGRGIYAEVDGEKPESVWWIGFDCAHLGDVSPRHEGEKHYSDISCTYKRFRFVELEVEELARQSKRPKDARAEGSE